MSLRFGLLLASDGVCMTLVSHENDECMQRFAYFSFWSLSMLHGSLTSNTYFMVSHVFSLLLQHLNSEGSVPLLISHVAQFCSISILKGKSFS